jgi:transcriptional regulator with XRE-family HTH domain
MSPLKVLREVNNYTQEYVAGRIGVDQSTYSKLERNPKNLLAEQAQKLAELYNVGLSDIISGGVSVAFSNNTIDKGYIHNRYEESMGRVTATKEEEIRLLKDEVEYLRNQNLQLLHLIGKKP